MISLYLLFYFGLFLSNAGLNIGLMKVFPPAMQIVKHFTQD